MFTLYKEWIENEKENTSDLTDSPKKDTCKTCDSLQIQIESLTTLNDDSKTIDELENKKDEHFKLVELMTSTRAKDSESCSTSIDEDKQIDQLQQRTAQIILDLQRLEEEFEMERKIMNKKYRVLQEHLNALKGDMNNLEGRSKQSLGKKIPVAKVPTGQSLLPNNSSEQLAEMDIRKMFARQSISADLPVFTGKPEDWPIFISSFNNSSEACGYNNVENLIRLQRCLRGAAREAVSSRLLLPECVPQVIDTLHMLYGRPELLIATLLTKVRQLCPPKEEDLNSLIVFGLAVKNLTDHMIAAEQQDHLNNPCLLQEIVDKLPAHFKLQWAVHKRRIRYITLSTFSDFMSEIVEAACEVSSIVVIGKSDSEQSNDDNCRRYKTDECQAPSTMSRKEKRNSCNICEGLNHRVHNCAEFNSATGAQRWEIVNGLQLCSSCLNRHLPWPCKTAQYCNVNGCRLKHHPMLHSTQTNYPSMSGGCFSNASATLKYVPVTLYGASKSLKTLAFIDEGSDCTLIESNLAKELDIAGANKSCELRWINGTRSKEIGSKIINLQISGADKGKRFSLSEVRTIRQLEIPAQSVNVAKLRLKHTHLQDIDVESYDHAKPRILIGLRHSHLITPSEIRMGNFDAPIASKCKLGWSIFGQMVCNN
ncbi:uncharacterized protein LOC131680608 [Topomyia yanbarensis]|uniref:uncharacterized protein LOC131680608 n=1 Tax=Topomyia yanbarensis TaxID=2498891 RepID=UPI00273C083A|nr:uncharacterized protein LOC131680608 [Topomyia yanbarensis]